MKACTLNRVQIFPNPSRPIPLSPERSKQEEEGEEEEGEEEEMPNVREGESSGGERES